MTTITCICGVSDFSLAHINVCPMAQKVMQDTQEQPNPIPIERARARKRQYHITHKHPYEKPTIELLMKGLGNDR